MKVFTIPCRSKYTQPMYLFIKSMNQHLSHGIGPEKICKSRQDIEDLRTIIKNGLRNRTKSSE